ncbi:MAG: FtsW/RodA/SpoVE family cell cycle protein, partial [Clostridia bacterium]
MKTKKNFDDITLFALAVGLAVFGLFMVFSASHYTAKTLYHDEFLFLKKQAVGVAIGLVGLCFFSKFNHQK